MARNTKKAPAQEATPEPFTPYQATVALFRFRLTDTIQIQNRAASGTPPPGSIA